MGIIGSIAGAVIGAKSSKSAANAQERAAQQEIALARETRDLTREDLAPFLGVGTNALSALNFEMGLGARPAFDGVEYGGFEKTPGYDFRLNEGVNALDMSAAARGGLNSGATLKAATQYGQNYATSEYGNYLNRLTGLASNGQNAAGAQAASNQFYSQQAGNALGSIGNAQAAGAIGVGNALQGGLQNATGWLGYQQAQQKPGEAFNWGKALTGF